MPLPSPFIKDPEVDRNFRDLENRVSKIESDPAGGGGTPDPHASTHLIGGSDEITTLPTTNQKQALQGTSGSPANGNRYVTDADSRNTNARTPTGSAGGHLTGTYPNPSIGNLVIVNAHVSASAAIAESKLDLASDAAAGTPSRRTLGTGSTQAAAGNHSHSDLPSAGEKAALAGTDGTPSGSNRYVTNSDPRNSDARTPTAHASSHQPGGGDPMTVDAAAGTGSLRTLGTASTAAAAGNDSRFPTTGQKAALAGTSGTPSDSNRYVTNADPRNTNARTPTSHATTHQPGGSDPMAVNAAAGTGSLRTLGTTSTSAAAGNHTHANLPTSGEKAALAGTNGTPAAGNPYVTHSDPRLSLASSVFVGAPPPSTSGPTTTSTADPMTAVIPEMTTGARTFPPGWTIFSFSGTFTHSANGGVIRIALYDGSTEIPGSRRSEVRPTAGQVMSIAIASFAVLFLSSTVTTISVRWNTSSGTATAQGTNRHFSFLELNI